MHEGIIDRGGRLHASCHKTLSAIPGIETIDMEWSPQASVGPTVSVSFKGWSPSLHQVWVQVLGQAPQDPESEDAGIDSILAMFEDAFARQRDRAGCAAALGYDRPLPLDALDHLWIDAGLGQVAWDQGVDIMQPVRTAIADLHGTTTLHRGDGTYRRRDAIVGEHECSGGTLRYVAPTINIWNGRRKAATHMGPELHIYADPLPETALAALRGRTVGDLIQLHRDVDGCTILDAQNDDTPGSRKILVSIEQKLEPLNPTSA